MTSSASSVRSFIFGPPPLHILEIKKPPPLHFFDLSILHERKCRSTPPPPFSRRRCLLRSFIRPSLESELSKNRADDGDIISEVD